jgi:hypothetical protein
MVCLKMLSHNTAYLHKYKRGYFKIFSHKRHKNFNLHISGIIHVLYYVNDLAYKGSDLRNCNKVVKYILLL